MSKNNIDVHPQSRVAQLAIQEFDSTLKKEKVTQIDPGHRCDASTCKYYITRRFSTAQFPAVVAVCKFSRHTHVCVPGKCGLSVLTPDSTHVCSLTGTLVSGPAEIQYASFSRPTVGRRANNTVHWISKNRHTAKNRRTGRFKLVRGLLNLIFTSPERHAISRAAAEHLHKTAIRVSKKFSTKTYHAYAAVQKHVLENLAMVRPPAGDVPERVVALIVNTIDFVREVGRRRNKVSRKNDTCLALGLVQLFSTGFSPLGSQLLKVDPWVAKHSLSPVQIGKLSGLRCRQQTIAVRQIQQLLVTENGEAMLQPPAAAQ